MPSVLNPPYSPNNEAPPQAVTIVGSISATIDETTLATNANQTTQITAEQAILAKLPTLAARTPTTSANTSSGNIAAGCRQITFIASADFSGTILTNLPLLAGAAITITAPSGDTIGAIAFTRAAGTLYTVELR